jgi:hypothetical protein
MTILRYAISIVLAIGLIALCAWVTAKVFDDDEDIYGSKR